MRDKKRKRGRSLPPDALTVSQSGVAVRVYGNDRGTPERAAQDGLEKLAVVETVEGGTRARASKTTDTIGRMLMNGTIDVSMARAARRFHADFMLAQLNGVKAAPLERRSKGLTDDSATLAARERVAGAVQILGGHGAPASMAVWFVVGCGYSVREWARRERFGSGGCLNEHTAKGILIGALSALSATASYSSNA